MARARNIKPSFFTNEDLVELPFEVRLLFIGLWTLADREGRLEDRPKRIKMAIFPADNVDIDAGLNALQESGFILRYEANGISILQVLNFKKHQNPHIKEASSELPPPNQHSASMVQAPDQHSASHADSLNPYSLNPERSRERGSKILTEGSAKTEKPDADASRSPPENQSISSEKSTRTTIPQPFRPTEAAVRLAEKHELDVGTEADLFVAHYESTGDFRADWDACFRKWLLRSMQHKADSEKRSQGPPYFPKNSRKFNALDAINGGDGYGNKRAESGQGRIIDIGGCVVEEGSQIQRLISD